MSGLVPPTAAETNTILRLLEDPTAGPVFVHCWRGADRTGSVIAAYRIDHDGWDNARALKEAMDSGMSWTQFPRRRYINTFHARTSAASAEKAARASADSANVLIAAPAGARN
jgi:protein tyrosine/serine phosphatase